MEGLPKYLIVFIHFLCPARRDRQREKEREGGKKNGERQRDERQHRRKARRDMGKKKGQRGRKEGKGHLLGITAETSLERLAVPSLE